MGVKLDDIKEIFEFIKMNIGVHFKDMFIIELGEEELKIFDDEKNSNFVIEYLKSDPRPYNINLIRNNNRIGLYLKDYLQKHFKEVLSINHNSRCPKTLREKIYNEIKVNHKYDILLNIGHTKDLGKNEIIDKNIIYESFRSIHNIVKKGGLIFNILPCDSRKNIGKSCSIYYSLEFFDGLARLCGYRIFYNNIIPRNSDSNNVNYHVHSHYVKCNNNDFIPEKMFMKLKKHLKINDDNLKKYF